MSGKIKFDYLPVGVLKPYENNAKDHGNDDVEAIAESIREFGFNDPIGIWGPENIIVEGHGRLLAAKKLGMTEVPVIRLDYLDDEQRRAYALAHNKTTELSVWNLETLAAELANIKDFDMAKFGFNVEDEIEAVEEDEYDDPVPENPRTKLGDLYQLGRHRLLCGDSTVLADVDRLMGGGVKLICF